MKIIQVNKNATFNYFVEDTFEAGISLYGAEVKSVRLGNLSLKESFVFIRGTVMAIKNMHIAPYDKGSKFVEIDPKRDRNLLMRKSEIKRLNDKVSQKGYSIIPTKIYLKGSLIKMEIALCKGKQAFDKRESIKDKDVKRSVERTLKEYNNR